MITGTSGPITYPLAAAAAPPSSRLVGWWRSVPPRLIFGVLVLVTVAPLAFVGLRVAEVSRNVVYWDEFNTALALVLRLKAGMNPSALLDDLFAMNNEHRMVTSRLIFATSYWLTGTVNFTVINLIGNASLVALCVMLVGAARTLGRRLRLAVILALGMFQLENFENFFWSGSSIDHFQVVFLVGAAMVGLAHGSRTSWLAAGLAAFLATLTLAHGILAWPIGAAMLAFTRGRPRFQLVGWCVLGAMVSAGYAAGFSPNSSHRFAGWSAEGAIGIGHYWLTLLGTVPAIGNTALAPWLGVMCLAILGWLARRGAWRREQISFSLACFGVASLALVAIGRSTESGGVVQSRYLVLGTLAWSLVVFMLLERHTHPRRPWGVFIWCLPLLTGFNLAANQTFAASADSWVECRDLAATRFKQGGVDGQGVFALHPVPARSTQLLAQAESMGVYRLGSVCEPRPFPRAPLSSRIAYFVDELAVNQRSAFVRGWAAIPGLPSKRGGIQVILRSATDTYVFTTVNARRPDVAEAFHDPQWERSGFYFVRRRDRLPSGDYQLGFLIRDGTKSEYVMTAHRLILENEGRGFLAGQE